MGELTWALIDGRVGHCPPILQDAFGTPGRLFLIDQYTFKLMDPVLRNRCYVFKNPDLPI